METTTQHMIMHEQGRAVLVHFIHIMINSPLSEDPHFHSDQDSSLSYHADGAIIGARRDGLVVQNELF
jgi:hypothetical protein